MTVRETVASRPPGLLSHLWTRLSLPPPLLLLLLPQQAIHDIHEEGRMVRDAMASDDVASQMMPPPGNPDHFNKPESIVTEVGRRTHRCLQAARAFSPHCYCDCDLSLHIPRAPFSRAIGHVPWNLSRTCRRVQNCDARPACDRQTNADARSICAV